MLFRNCRLSLLRDRTCTAKVAAGGSIWWPISKPLDTPEAGKRLACSSPCLTVEASSQDLSACAWRIKYHGLRAECVCVSACIVCERACVYRCMCICVHVCARVHCVHVCVYMCAHMCMYACICMCMSVCGCECIHAHACVWWGCEAPSSAQHSGSSVCHVNQEKGASLDIRSFSGS